MTHKALLLTIMFFVSLWAVAQSGTMEGVVVDANTEEPVPSVTILVHKGMLKGADADDVVWTGGATTNMDGKFKIQISGPVTLKFTYVGYEPRIMALNSVPSSTVKIRLKPQSKELEDVSVVGKQKSDFQSIDASAAIESADVSGGVESVVKSQMGVASNSELSSQYRVRGGNFDENMVYVNNIEVYRPFLIRSGEQEGLSFVNPDMVESLKFSSGCFDATYSDKMSSVLDVKYKTPTEDRYGARISLMGAQAHIEGASERGEYAHLTGLRYKTNQYMLGSLDTKGDYDPQFFDVQSYHSLRLSRKSRLSFLGYYSSNKYHFKPSDRETTFGTLADTRKFKIYFDGQESDNYNSGFFASSFSIAPDEDRLYTLNVSMYRSKEQENYDILGEYWLQQADAESNIGVGGYMEHARNELYNVIGTYAIRVRQLVGSNDLTWEAKVQTERFDDYMSEWAYTDSAGYLASPSNGVIEFDRYLHADNNLKSTRVSAFVQDDISINRPHGRRLDFGWGIRASYWDANAETVVSPRLYWTLTTRKWIYRFAMGRYAQVPFFRELRREDGTLNETVNAQNSWQFLFGGDLYFLADARPFKFTVEGYVKLLQKLNPYSVDNVRIRYAGRNCAKGYTVGIDAKINGELVPGVESWACLSFMRSVEKLDYARSKGYIPRPSDQLVSFSMFFQDYLPSNKSVGASLNFYIGTGLPFGPPNSPRYMATNRMPGYKRVDFGMFKDFAKTDYGGDKWPVIKSCKLGLEVFNLFDFANTISYFWVSDVNGGKYAVPNYLTSRRINVKFSFEFKRPEKRDKE